MTLNQKLAERLRFLARVVRKESEYLKQTDARLFAVPFTAEIASRLESEMALAEQVEAFVGRFGRLQDTLGDKLLPVLLLAIGEQPAPLLDNMASAEKWGWIASAEDWFAMRQLRNQMVHEYIEDAVVLASALNAGHAFVPVLCSAADRLLAEAGHRLQGAPG